MKNPMIICICMFTCGLGTPAKFCTPSMHANYGLRNHPSETLYSLPQVNLFAKEWSVIKGAWLLVSFHPALCRVILVKKKQAKTGDTPLDWCLPHYKQINLCERVQHCACIGRYCMYQICRYCYLSQWMPCKLGSGEMLQYRYKSLSHLVMSYSIVVMPDQG